ncbi:MAG: family 43 glycosylhydrolase, partial [Bacteroidota bacterium]
MKTKPISVKITVFLTLICVDLGMVSCGSQSAKDEPSSETTSVPAGDTLRPISNPLVSHIYTADPSAHVFDRRIYIYPSHDINADVPEDDLGSHFDMKDYHILSMDSIGGKVTDHGVAIDIKDIPWVGRQLWAPDAAFSNGKYYLYFPAKDKKDVFRIGVAVSDSPGGPFKAEPQPIEGSYSIDPAVFKDTDGKYYMYFGGIWGGQLQRWDKGKYDANGSKTDRRDNGPAIRPRVVRLSDDMLSFAEPVKEVD